MITGSHTRGSAVKLSTGQRQAILSDISRTLGGEEEGLSPHELVESSLAACTLFTLQLYAKRKGWDVSHLKVEVKIEKEGAESVFSRKIHWGEVTDEQREKLLEIANKCPIHKLLESSIRVETA
jgi:putative redox protein